MILLCCLSLCRSFGQDTSAIAKLLQGKVPGLSTAKGTYISKTDREQEFQRQLQDAGITIHLDNKFHVADPSNIHYHPKPLLSKWDWFPMLRTVAIDSDASYMIGLFVFPGWKIYSKESLLLESEMNRWRNKNSRYISLSPVQLRKINTDSGTARGVIYDLDISIPFKNRYYKCKVLAAENAKHNYMALYYFYNDKSDKEIMRTISSQLGMVRFE